MSVQAHIQRSWKGFSMDVSLHTQGEILGILGASGSGKSMTLKCIAGIETPHKGKITVGAQVVYDSQKRICLRPQQRRIGYLFQNYALFPHLTVADNVGCALSHLPKQQRQAKIEAALSRFRLDELGHRFPGQLSGGQQQRVAFARLLAYQPQVLLLDEPFSALDYYLKEMLQLELLDFLSDYEGDVIMVTHDRDEVYRMCQRLMVLENGRCIAQGATQALFADPGHLSIAQLTGCKNISRATPTDTHTIFARDWGVALQVDRPIPPDIDCVGIRAHDFVPVDSPPQQNLPNCFAVTVQNQLEAPFEWNILFAAPSKKEGAPIWWKVAKEQYQGQPPRYLSIAPHKILLLRSGQQQSPDTAAPP